jgi:hypothetical protein
MGAKAARKEETVNEDVLLKAIKELEATAVKKAAGSTEPVPEQMKSTKAARGGGSELNDPNEEASELDMAAAEGDAAAKAEGDEEVVEADVEDAVKAYDKDDDSGESDDSDESSEDSEMTTKSYKSKARDRADIKKAVEVSPFMREITDFVGDSLDQMAKSLDARDARQQSFFGSLRKAMVAMGNEIVDLRDQVASFGNSPAQPRKSQLTKSDIEDRDMPTNREGQSDDHADNGAANAPKIGKADVSNLLCEMVEKGELAPEVVIEFEETNRLPNPIAAKVKEHFASIGE